VLQKIKEPTVLESKEKIISIEDFLDILRPADGIFSQPSIERVKRENRRV
jgi:hypothetical protein